MAEQEFDALRPEDRPQDSSGDGEGLAVHDARTRRNEYAAGYRGHGRRRALGGVRAAQKEREDRAAKTASGESGIRLEAERGQRLGAGTPPPLPTRSGLGNPCCRSV